MNGNQPIKQAPKCNPLEKSIELRAVHKYIETSLWDENMNRIREYWLWERKGISTKNKQNYNYKGDNDYETV